MKREFKVQGRTFTFDNRSFSNSRNWGHICELSINNFLVATSKAIYLNRTWESYQYQSVMEDALNKYIDKLLQEATAEYKIINGLSRLSIARKMEIEKQFKKVNRSLFNLKEKI